ncbi:MAG: thioredoxin [Pseudomonadota bacterium]
MALKNILAVAAFALGAVAVIYIGRAPATGATAQSAYDGEPEIIAATFASAWCSSCKVLEPRLKKIIPDFRERPVRFIEFDFTFGKNDGHADLAAETGLAEVFDRFQDATGFTLLVDAESGEVIDMLTINHSQDAMRMAIAQAIAVAARPELQQSDQNRGVE